MAGSYNHIINENGELLDNFEFVQMIENLGDAYDAITEMYDMIQYLSDGDKEQVFEAYCHHIEKVGGNIDYVRQRGIEGYFED